MTDTLAMFGVGLIGWVIGLGLALAIGGVVSVGAPFGALLGGGLSLSGWAIGAMVYIDCRYDR